MTLTRSLTTALLALSLVFARTVQLPLVLAAQCTDEAFNETRRFLADHDSAEYRQLLVVINAEESTAI
jgi:hypothetical protein